MCETIIIYKTYTPQRQAYCKKYYQEHKEQLLEKNSRRFKETYADKKDTEEFKEKRKQYQQLLKQNESRPRQSRTNERIQKTALFE